MLWTYLCSSRTITGKFKWQEFVTVGDKGYICTKIKNVYKVQQVGTNNWNAVAYGNGKYVAVGEKGYVTMSSDGVNWSTPKQVGSSDWNAIVYGNGKFVSVGTRGTAAYSTNGVDWTTFNLSKAAGSTGSGTETEWNGITFNNGKFIAVGAYTTSSVYDYLGYTTTSKDALEWTGSKQISTSRLLDVQYGEDGYYVTVGGKIHTGKTPAYYTTNGLEWLTKIVSWDDLTFNSVSFGNGVWVTVGNNGRIGTIENIVEDRWSVQTVGSNAWNNVIYSNGKFLAVGNQGYITSSIDGINWTTPAQLVSESNLRGICIMP